MDRDRGERVTSDEKILRKAAAIRLLQKLSPELVDHLVVRNGQLWDLPVPQRSASRHLEDFDDIVSQCFRPAISMALEELRKKLREIVDEKVETDAPK